MCSDRTKAFIFKSIGIEDLTNVLSCIQLDVCVYICMFRNALMRKNKVERYTLAKHLDFKVA